jgi:sec-independent protein translocase protein TatA
MFISSPTKDLLVILVIVLLIFGPKRLPGLGKQLGQGLREFRDSITGSDHDDADEHPQIAQSGAAASGNGAAAAGTAPSAESRPVQPVSSERS